MKEIKVTVLSPADNEEAMRFIFPNADKIDVSLTGSNGNVQLKYVFEAILAIQMDDDVTVSFEPTNGYGNGMYIQVCKAYVESLQRELDQVRSLIVSEEF